MTTTHGLRIDELVDLIYILDNVGSYMLQKNGLRTFADGDASPRLLELDATHATLGCVHGVWGQADPECTNLVTEECKVPLVFIRNRYFTREDKAQWVTTRAEWKVRDHSVSDRQVETLEDGWTKTTVVITTWEPPTGLTASTFRPTRRPTHPGGIPTGRRGATEAPPNSGGTPSDSAVAAEQTPTSGISDPTSAAPAAGPSSSS